jgi:hypothetical protein
MHDELTRGTLVLLAMCALLGCGHDGSKVDAAGADADLAPDRVELPDVAGDRAVDIALPPDAAVIPDAAADVASDLALAPDRAPDVIPPDAGPAALEPWPGGAAVELADGAKVFGKNLSGLTYQPAAGGSPAILWAVQNNPSRLFRLEWDGKVWAPATAAGWSSGKELRYPNGGGSPDTEDLTKPDWDAGIFYVVAERDNGDTTSRNSILRFDASAGGPLTATHEWNLTADLPAVGGNTGLEAITWIPDAFLVAHQYRDDSTGQPYDPARYPDHGTGLFFVGLETSGVIYVYALDHTHGTFKRLSDFTSGHPAVMALQFDRETGALWAACDDTCEDRQTVHQIDVAPGSATRGRFVVRRRYRPPTGLGTKLNAEGIAFAPESECMAGRKAFFWADDDATDDHSLRRGTIPCGDVFSAGP